MIFIDEILLLILSHIDQIYLLKYKVINKQFYNQINIIKNKNANLTWGKVIENNLYLNIKDFLHKAYNYDLLLYLSSKYNNIKMINWTIKNEHIIRINYIKRLSEIPDNMGFASMLDEEYYNVSIDVDLFTYKRACINNICLSNACSNKNKKMIKIFLKRRANNIEDEIIKAYNDKNYNFINLITKLTFKLYY
jgi:hypothetical protein